MTWLGDVWRPGYVGPGSELITAAFPEKPVSLKQSKTQRLQDMTYDLVDMRLLWASGFLQLFQAKWTGSPLVSPSVLIISWLK